jgi:hypothetical protein
MNAGPDVERRISDWLAEEVPTRAPDRILPVAFERSRHTHQRRLGAAWRSNPMNATMWRIAAAAVIGLIVIVGGFAFLGGASPADVGTPGGMPTPTPTPAATPAAIQDGPLAPGRYVSTGGPLPYDVPVRFTFDVPGGWSGISGSVWLTGKEASPPDGASFGFGPGGSLHSEPCGAPPPPGIEVGPSVDDFANALADHPLLDVTEPVGITLVGYTGKYVDLQIPSDISACPTSYFPWEPGIYAQGPGQQWHLWILDVDGVRVVVQTTDYAGTSAEDRAALEAMVDSLQIETVVAPATSPSASP